MAKVSRLEEKLNSCLESRDYYEAHQVYRTLYYRMSSQGKWHEIQDLLYNGALKLVSVSEPTSAIDLAELYVETLIKSKTPATFDVLDRIEQLFMRLPAALEHDTSHEGHRVDRRQQLLSLAFKWSMSVGEKRRHREKGHPGLHTRIGSVLWSEGNYCAARGHFMLGDNAEKFAKFLIDFQQKCGFEGECDLFIAQAVLQSLCSRKLKMATIMLQQYCEGHPEIKSEPPYNFPLLNFVWLLTLCIPIKKLTMFSSLIEQYSKCIDRDPSYRSYLDKIGQLYFGLPPPQRQPAGGILGSLIKGLMGSSQENGEQMDDLDSSDEEFLSNGTFADEEAYMTAASSAEAVFPPPLHESSDVDLQASSSSAAQPPPPKRANNDDDMDLD